MKSRLLTTSHRLCFGFALGVVGVLSVQSGSPVAAQGYGMSSQAGPSADTQPLPEPVVSPWEMPPGTAIWALPAQSPHRVVRQPPLLSHDELKRQAHRDKFGPPVATIPKAAVSPVWRQPYAYGYFGAQPARHWQRHFGWNRSYTQWTLK